jgi:hypothetical protein
MYIFFQSHIFLKCEYFLKSLKNYKTEEGNLKKPTENEKQERKSRKVKKTRKNWKNR